MPLLAAPIQDLRGCFLDHVDGDTSLDFSLVTDPMAVVRFNGGHGAALAFSLVVGPDADVRFQAKPNEMPAFSLASRQNAIKRTRARPDATLDWLQRNFEVDLSKEINFDEVFI
jgi:hypothetical protein